MTIYLSLHRTSVESLERITKAWGWAGIRPAEVVSENDFGNLIVRDQQGQYWRICPEDLYCKVVALDQAKLGALFMEQEFLADWQMDALVREAQALLGALEPGHKYCLKRPSPLGGDYGGNNLAQMPFAELLSAAGHMAHQLDGLPDGAAIRLHVDIH